MNGDSDSVPSPASSSTAGRVITIKRKEVRRLDQVDHFVTERKGSLPKFFRVRRGRRARSRYKYTASFLKPPKVYKFFSQTHCPEILNSDFSVAFTGASECSDPGAKLAILLTQATIEHAREHLIVTGGAAGIVGNNRGTRGIV